MKKARCRLRAVSLFLGPSSKKALDTQITTRVTEGALVFRVSRRINALARMHSLQKIWRKRETACSLSKLWKVWQEKDLIFPPFQNYLQVPCQKLKKGTTEDHHEHQLTPEAGQMIYHISQVFQPTNTLQIKKKELFALKAQACSAVKWLYTVQLIFGLKPGFH